jgi:hypothetical protein
MSQKFMHVLARLVNDADFRARVAQSLQDVCIEEGIRLTQEEIAFLGSIDFERFGQLLDSIDESIENNRIWLKGGNNGKVQ